MQSKCKNLIHKTFEVGIFLKGANGVLEIIGGVLLLAVSPRAISRLAVFLTQNELSKDPKDFLANFLLKSAHDLAVSGQLFGALFLLSHGIIKLFLIIALFKKKFWAYPLAMAVFGLFIIYQMYRYFLGHSVWMLVLSILDIVVIVLTYWEMKNLEHKV